MTLVSLLGVAIAAAGHASPSGAPATGESKTIATITQRTQLAAPPRSLERFTLTDQEGRAVQLADLRGQPVLVFFGFTHCEDVCPATLQVLRQVRRELEASKAVPAVVMISVDGDRDTAAVMNRYLAPFGHGFIGLTGDPQLVRGIAAQFSAVFFKGAPADESGDYQVEHTSQVYLLDREGKLSATFYGAPTPEIAAILRRE